MAKDSHPYQKKLKSYLALSGGLFILGFWLGNLLSDLPGETVIEQFNFLFSNHLLSHLLQQNLRFLYWPTALGFLLAVIGGFIGLVAYVRGNDHGVYRNNEEHGSARLATLEEINHFADPGGDI